MRLIKCLLSVYAFLLFWGTILLFLFPSLIVYFIAYFFVKYPQDYFQYLSSVIFKIFFKLLPVVKIKLDLLDVVPQSAIYIATHQSNIDYPLLGSFIKKYLTITNVNFVTIPFISYVANLIGVRLLKRSNLNDVSYMYEELAKNLNENRNVIIFPEGTRGDGSKLKKFRKGAFRLSKETNKPIIPIQIDGSGKVLAKGEPCFKTLKTTEVKVKMFPPLYPDDFKNEEEMLKKAVEILEYKRD
jgi:1-acyl-sn-glycerol-3-phosphate acyltransferase